MPFIKRRKKGRFPGWGGNEAYEFIEVDTNGNPIIREMDNVNKSISLTEKKIGPGMRAPDKVKGYDKPFDYHQWNALRKKGLVGKKRKKNEVDTNGKNSKRKTR